MIAQITQNQNKFNTESAYKIFVKSTHWKIIANETTKFFQNCPVSETKIIINFKLLFIKQ